MNDLNDIKKFAGGELSEVTRSYIWIPDHTECNCKRVKVRIDVVEVSSESYEARPSHKVKKGCDQESTFCYGLGGTPILALSDSIGRFRAVMARQGETNLVTSSIEDEETYSISFKRISKEEMERDFPHPCDGGYEPVLCPRCKHTVHLTRSKGLGDDAAGWCEECKGVVWSPTSR